MAGLVDHVDAGEWVEIQQGKLPDPEGPWNTVKDRFDTTLQHAEDMLELLVGPDGESGYLGDLNRAIDAAPPISVSAPGVDTNLDLATGKTTVPDFDPSLLGDYPNEQYPVPKILDYPDETYPAPKMREYPDEQYATPVLADLPGIDVSGLRSVPEVPEVGGELLWEGRPFTSELYPVIVARLLRDLRDGATGLPEHVEEAIYRRAKTRQQADRLKLYEDMVHTAAQMQFQYPSGVLLSALNGYAVAANRMDAEIEDNIIEQQAKLAQQNSQFVIEQSIRLEEIIRRTWNDEEARRLDFEKSKIDLLLRGYAERVRAMTARIEAERAYVQAQAEYLRGVIDANRGKVDIYKAQYDALKTRIEAVSSMNQGELAVFKTQYDALATRVQATTARNSGAVEVFKAQYDALNTRVQATATRNKGLTDTYTAQVSAYGEEQRAVATYNQAKIEELKARVQAADLQLRAAIANAEKAIQGYSAEMSLREKVASSMAGIAAQSVASWAGAVSASASLGYSASEGKHESWSHSNSISESHGYSHDAYDQGQTPP